jgi:hypothetical protein
MPFKPILSLDIPSLGPLVFRHLSVGATIELQEIDEKHPFEPAPFFDQLLGRLGSFAPSSDGDTEPAKPITQEDIAKLSSEERERIAEALIPALRLHTEATRETETDSEGNRTSRISGHKVVLDREDGEAPDAFLLRAWRDQCRRLTESAKSMMKSVLGEASGISEALKNAITPGLLTNITASQRLSAQISQMMPKVRIADQFKGITTISDRFKDLGIGNIGRDIGALGKTGSSIGDTGRSTAFPRYEEFVAPELPELNFENPLFETNERLGEMGEHIAEMRALAATTATMQQSLNTVATQILTQFAEGAEKSKKVGYLALAVGVISAVLALVAILTGLWGDLRQNDMDRASDRAAQSRLAEELTIRRQELEASNRLAAAIEAQRPPTPPAPAPKQ